MRQLSFIESKRILNKYGVKMIDSIIIKSKKELQGVGKKIRYPLVLKAYSGSVIHKAKEGYTKTNILDKRELEKTYNELMKKLNKVDANEFSIVLQEQMSGMEFIIGAKSDDVFDYAVIFGLGGIYTETLNRISTRICPITKELAKEMVEEVAGKINIDKELKEKLQEIILNVSKLIKEEGIAELDLNPVMVSSKEVNIVDVRMLK
jgi:succinyl-CoA synthetase beta subunit